MQVRPRRSVLYVPATSEKALAKLPTLACDAVVVDLEDSVAPERKAEARAGLAALFSGRPRDGREWVIRINGLAGEWGAADLAAAADCRPDAILLPKVDGPHDVLAAADALDAMEAGLALWAMIETPRGLLEIASIAALGAGEGARLACLVAGTNDLVEETGIRATPDRRLLVPWLQQIVLAARAGGLAVLDGVCNDFADLDAFAAECAQGRDLGFDGKTLIHPAQIGPANAAFSPSAEEIAEARAIVAAFAAPGAEGLGAIRLDGRMVERLHLASARRLLARAGLTVETS